MFFSKKKKTLSTSRRFGSDTPFALLLKDVSDGTLKQNLTALRLTRISVYTDLLETKECIGISARYGGYFLELQVYPTEFEISFDEDEPEEGTTYPLESKDQFYSVLSSVVDSL